MCRLSGIIVINPPGQASRVFENNDVLPSLFSQHLSASHFSGQYLLLTSNFWSLEVAFVLQRAQDTAGLGDPEGEQ